MLSLNPLPRESILSMTSLLNFTTGTQERPEASNTHQRQLDKPSSFSSSPEEASFYPNQ